MRRHTPSSGLVVRQRRCAGRSRMETVDGQVVLDEEVDPDYEPTEQGASHAAKRCCAPRLHATACAPTSSTSATTDDEALLRLRACRGRGLCQVARHRSRRGKGECPAAVSVLPPGATVLDLAPQPITLLPSPVSVLLAPPQDFLWIARDGLKAPLPDGWKPWCVSGCPAACLLGKGRSDVDCSD